MFNSGSEMYFYAPAECLFLFFHYFMFSLRRNSKSQRLINTLPERLLIHNATQQR